MEDVVRLLQNLVRIPSVNPADLQTEDQLDPGIHCEARLATWLGRYLEDNGFDVSIEEVRPGRPNLIARSRTKDNSQPAVCLCSHLDVVPVGGMTIDPFAADIHSGMMWGRGTSDPKGSVAAMTIAAIEEAKEDNAPPIVLLFTMDEEAGFTGATAWTEKEIPSLLGAIIGEPTALTMITGHKGIYRTNIRVTGVSAHASMPHTGVNAIYRMSAIVARLQLYADALETRPAHRLLGTATLNVGIIEGGVAFNSVPDSCSISIDRRTLPNESIADIHSEIEAALRSLDFSEDIVIDEPILFAPGFETPDGKWLSGVSKALNQTAGVAAPYATDGAVLQRAGIDCVVYGPGEMITAHTCDEHIPIDQVLNAVLGYRTIIQAFAN